MDILILAAGQGKRMRSAQPKVLQPVAGRPLLDHVIDCARALQPARICIVVGHGAESVRRAFPAPDLRWAHQAEQLGTGHAVACGLAALDADGASPAPVLVLYGDVPLVRAATLNPLATAVAAGAGLALLTAQVQPATGYGRIVRAADGAVLRIVEEKDASPQERVIEEINTGILMAPAASLRDWLQRIGNDNAQREYYLTDVVALAVAAGVRVHTDTAPVWQIQGANDRRQLAALERLYQHQRAEELLEAGVTLLDPARLDVRGSLVCGQDVEIDVNCVFAGKVELGDGVRIGAHCVIRDSTLAAGTQVAPFSHIEGANIGEECRLGPYVRIRPGTELQREVHLGNFVEIKNSRIAAESKAGHLAYVGDAEIGCRVNIGAGTITCNYDGANKHRTVIEDDVFVGSDTQLVAPVRVGRGATLGAGTTLTKDAPADSLTVSRARQVSLKGWKRPGKTQSHKDVKEAPST